MTQRPIIPTRLPQVRIFNARDTYEATAVADGQVATWARVANASSAPLDDQINRWILDSRSYVTFIAAPALRIEVVSASLRVYHHSTSVLYHPPSENENDPATAR